MIFNDEVKIIGMDFTFLIEFITCEIFNNNHIRCLINVEIFSKLFLIITSKSNEHLFIHKEGKIIF